MHRDLHLGPVRNPLPGLLAAGALLALIPQLGSPATAPWGSMEPEDFLAQEPPEPAPIPAPQEKRKGGQLYSWNANGRRVTRIVVSLDEQRVRFYSGGEQIGWSTIASGIKKFPTPTGHFEVMERIRNKRSTLYGKLLGKGGRVIRAGVSLKKDSIPSGSRFEGAEMPFFLRLTYDGIGLHAGAIPRPGHPASHGCIRLPKKLAQTLFSQVSVGTAVTIHGRGPSYGHYAHKQRVAAAKHALAEKQALEAAAAAVAALSAGALGSEALVSNPIENAPVAPGFDRPASPRQPPPGFTDKPFALHLPVRGVSPPILFHPAGLALGGLAGEIPPEDAPAPAPLPPGGT